MNRLCDRSFEIFFCGDNHFYIAAQRSEAGLSVELDTVASDFKILAVDLGGVITREDAGFEVKDRLRQFNENFPSVAIEGFELEALHIDNLRIDFFGHRRFQKHESLSVFIVLGNLDSIHRHPLWNGQVETS